MPITLAKADGRTQQIEPKNLVAVCWTSNGTRYAIVKDKNNIETRVEITDEPHDLVKRAEIALMPPKTPAKPGQKAAIPKPRGYDPTEK